jgi:hypothetical protein
VPHGCIVVDIQRHGILNALEGEEFFDASEPARPHSLPAHNTQHMRLPDLYGDNGCGVGERTIALLTDCFHAACLSAKSARSERLAISRHQAQQSSSISSS